MMCLEWWLFEIANMLAGLLPNAEESLAVGGVCVQLVSLAFMVPLGVSIGLRIRVSHLLGAPSSLCACNCYLKPGASSRTTRTAAAGAGDGKAAKRAIAAALSIIVVLVAVYLTGLLTLRTTLARLFFPFAAANSPELRTLQDCILLVAAGGLGDWTNCTLAGALQGAGRQDTGAKIYCVSHWLLGTSLLWLLGFQLGFGVRGIWAALAIVSNVQCLFMLVRSYLCYNKDAAVCTLLSDNMAAGLLRVSFFRTTEQPCRLFRRPVAPYCLTTWLRCRRLCCESTGNTRRCLPSSALAPLLGVPLSKI